MENFFRSLKTEILPEFFAMLNREGKSPKTIEYYRQYIENFVKFTNITADDLQSKRTFEAKYQKLWERPIKNATRKKYLQAMQRFIDFVIEYELAELEENILKKIKPPKVQKSIIPAMEIFDINHIFNIARRIWSGAIRERNMMILKTFLFAGLRRSELLNLQKSNITKDYILVRQGKGNKDRTVYIPENFSEELHDFCTRISHPTAVFVNKFGNPISLMVIRRLFDELNKFSSVHLYPHRLRHEYGNRLSELKVAPAIIRDQMGHSSISTTDKYIVTRDSHRKRAMQILDYDEDKEEEK